MPDTEDPMVTLRKDIAGRLREARREEREAKAANKTAEVIICKGEALGFAAVLDMIDARLPKEPPDGGR